MTLYKLMNRGNFKFLEFSGFGKEDIDIDEKGITLLHSEGRTGEG